LKVSLQLGFDFNSLLNLIWFVIVILVLYWLFTTLRRIERTLQEVKKKLGSSSSVWPSLGEKSISSVRY